MSNINVCKVIYITDRLDALNMQQNRGSKSWSLNLHLISPTNTDSQILIQKFENPLLNKLFE